MTADLSLEQRLDAFDPAERDAALQVAAARFAAGQLPSPAPQGRVNVHLHTFYSFNAENFSPARLVVEGRRRGVEVIGAIDFDVLDAMDETYRAGETIGLRTVVSLETRAFVPEFAEVELNSPGEPGVYYFMGAGFTRLPDPASAAGQTLAAMRASARRRNEAILERLQPHLKPLRIDYAADVLPLTPSGNATERHMLAALDEAARRQLEGRPEVVKFWESALGLTREQIEPLLENPAQLRNTVRAKLMKRGGPGYVQPDRTTFPPLDEVVRMMLDCEAIPCATWLDGTSPGEADAAAWLDFFRARGCLGLSIVPDRNWNIKDPETKKKKVAKFDEIVEEGRERNFLFAIGTEMNNYGLPFVDDFSAPEMAKHAATFRDGALALYGHSLLQRALGKGRVSAWARATFGDDLAAANAFFTDAGKLGFPPRVAREALKRTRTDDPDELLATLRKL